MQEYARVTPLNSHGRLSSISIFTTGPIALEKKFSMACAENEKCLGRARVHESITLRKVYNYSEALLCG